MGKKIFVFLFFIISYASAQTATVSGTITDANGQAFINGSYLITLKTVSGNPGPYATNPGGAAFIQRFSGSLNSTGSFPAIVIQRTDFIAPSGTTWTFQVCSQASSACFSTNIVVTTSTLNVSTLITPPAIQVNPTPLALAYNDSEITPTNLTSAYRNLTDSSIHYCVTAINQNSTCTAWGVGGRTVIFSNTNIVGDTVSTTGTPFATVYLFPAGTMCPVVGTVYNFVLSGTFTTSSGVPFFDLGIGIIRVLQASGIGNGSSPFIWSATLTATCIGTGINGALFTVGNNLYTGSGSSGYTASSASLQYSYFQIDLSGIIQITPLAQFTQTGTMTLLSFQIFQTR